MPVPSVGHSEQKTKQTFASKELKSKLCKYYNYDKKMFHVKGSSKERHG